MATAPWQFGAGVGVFLFVAIRYGISGYFASLDGVVFATAGDSLSNIFSLLAWFALAVCWFAAGLSFISRPRRRKAASGVESMQLSSFSTAPARRASAPADQVAPTIRRNFGSDDQPELRDPAPVTNENMDNLSWLQFEQLVAASFRQMGFDAELTAEGADGGIDIVLRKGGTMSLVQCKHWDNYSVGVKIVRELFGVMHARQAQKAILVTSSQLTGDARRFCEANSIGYFDRGGLLAFVDPAAMPPLYEISKDRSRLCPFCSSPLKLRKARKTGMQFYGCSRYPRCKGTRSADND